MGHIKKIKSFFSVVTWPGLRMDNSGFQPDNNRKERDNNRKERDNNNTRR
jgi:hypothetical protein